MKTTIQLFILFIISTTALAQDNGNIDIDKTYDINQKGTLYLKSDDADVSITGTDRKDVHVKIHRRYVEKGIVMGERDFKVEITERSGDLYIEDFEQSGTITIVGYMNEHYEITIEMPKTISLNIKGDDDDYHIKNINGKIRMNVDDGDARFTNCKGSYFDFDFDDGDIVMDVGSGELKLALDDGDFEVEKADFSKVNASVDDGDINIKTSLDNNGTYSFTIDDGSVELTVLSGGGEFTIYHDETSISTIGEFNKTSDYDNKSILNLSKGTANVKIRSDDGQIRLKAM
ncbi:MAG: DUF4097 domain-containing protein [Cyclobacteriaceae bacterium]|nr:DUF4097 domain-containing protein [Cyclobacteriaceae bacterium]